MSFRVEKYFSDEQARANAERRYQRDWDLMVWKRRQKVARRAAAIEIAELVKISSATRLRR